jgi:mannan endo-1,4-beta-mannosidase
MMKPSLLLLCAFFLTGAAPLSVFHTSGRFLLDPCGDTVVVRGVEIPVNQIQYIPEVAKTGANFVRILISIPPADYPTTAADLDSMLSLTKKNGMGADVSLNNNAGDGSSFIAADYMAVLKKYEDIITLHAQGEGQQTTVAAWLSDAKAAITRIRNAGYRCPLYILSTTSGRDPFTILHNGQQLVDFDPLHNILCGVQLYWGYTSAGSPGWYIGDYKMTDKAAIDSFALKSFPIVAGINNHDPYGDPWLDYETQLSETAAKNISWFWWDWFNPYDGSGKYHLSLTGRYGDWGVCLAGAPDLDKFTISGTGTASRLYEAENYTAFANIGWGKYSQSSVSGGGFLCCSGKQRPDWAEWNQVDGGTGGSRTLTITYSNGDNYFNQPLAVLVNGDSVGTLTCGYSGPGANDSNFWRVWKDESIAITLKPGLNTIRMVSTATTGHFNPNYGERTIISHPASIKNTSKKTNYMQNHACGITKVQTSTPTVHAKPPALFPLVAASPVTILDIAGKTVKIIDGKPGLNRADAMQRLCHGVYLVRIVRVSGGGGQVLLVK